MTRNRKNQNTEIDDNIDSSDKCNNISNDFEEQFHEELGTQIIDDIYMPPPPIQPKNLDDQTGERLIIETIGITNFKSFGGYTILGPFYKSFNSIVGPNGSGKSNVIDSMLFVFGYRAQKLRCTKISSIIHYSETMTDCQYARVDVNFAMINDKGDDNIDIIDGSKFTISRMVNKDNTSYYMIDNRRVMFRDVSKKLNDVGIDLCYNRFLILQGEVEQISLMKPKADQNNDIGMLEYLENIIGTSRYKDPIDKLSIKYNELNEQRTQYVIRVNYAKKELKSVEKARNEAIQALLLENKKKIEKSKLIQYKQYNLMKKMKKYEIEYEKYEQTMNNLNNDEKSINDEKLKLNEMEKTKSMEYKLIKNQSDELKLKFQECNKNDLYLNQRIKTTKDKLKKIKNKINENETILNNYNQNDNDNDNKNIEKLEKLLKKMTAEIEEIDEKINKKMIVAQKESEQLIKQREKLNLEFIEFKDKQNVKLDQMNRANNQYQLYKQQIDSIKLKCDQLKNKFQQIQIETNEKNEMIRKYRQEIPNDENNLKKLQQKLQYLEQKRNDLSKIIQRKATELLNRRQSFNKIQSRDAIRNALMNAKHKGQLNGIYGRLGDLGSIDKKYDVAVSTACGRLKNFVVDTIDNAQKCVEFLKENQLPPVTFIALDKVKVQWQKSVKYPENVPRLFDLIKINDERICSAFYYAMGETLVAKDIDQARRITKKNRYRVVTLNGNLIEMDGAMSGGGKPKSGGMGDTIVDDEYAEQSEKSIELIEKDIKSLEMERQQIDAEIDSVNNNINDMEKDLRIMEEKLNDYQMDVKESDNRLKQIEENIEREMNELNKFNNNDNRQLNDAEQLYLKYKEIYEKSMSETNVLQDNIRELENQIDEIIDKHVGILKKQQKQLEKNIKDNQSKLTDLISEKTAAELNRKKAEETLENSRKNQQEIENELIDIKEQIKNLEINAKEITEKYEQTNLNCQQKQQELMEIQKRLDEINNRFNKIKNQKLDLKLEADEKFKYLNENREKIQRYKNELQSIKLDQIDFDDMDVDNQDNDNNDENLNKAMNEMKIPELTDDEFENLSIEIIEKNIKSIEMELGNLSPNFSAIEIFRKHRNDYLMKLSDLNEITQKRDKYMEHLRDVKDRRYKEFKNGCLIISRKLKELYRSITLGGDADLEFIDSLDPFSEGVNYSVRPNKKTWKINIHLSGGEKTLASLALIFALHYYKPSPLYIMDEIDAALDFKNVSIIANYIKERTKNTQFLIVSLRNNMYELADRLIGIYKTFNITKSIPFDPIAFDKKFNDDDDNNEIASSQN